MGKEILLRLVGAIGLEPTTPTMSIMQCGEAVVPRQLLTVPGSAPERLQAPQHDGTGLSDVPSCVTPGGSRSSVLPAP